MAPRKDDYLTKAAAYLAEVQAENKAKRIPVKRIYRNNTNGGMDTADFYPGSVELGARADSGSPDAGTVMLGREGYKFNTGDEWRDALAAHYPAPHVETIPATPFSRKQSIAAGKAAGWYDEGLARSAMEPEAPPAPRAPVAARPAPAQNRSTTIRLNSASSAMNQRAPEARPLGQYAPKEGDRYAALPEGVASYMRQRSGLEQAQGESNRRALGVELASAFNQIGTGIGGGRYNDSAWDNQRRAARQPLEDYLQQEEGTRQEQEANRRAMADQRAAQEGQRKAAGEERQFAYQREQDGLDERFRRDQLAQQGRLAEANQRGEAADRALRREQFRFQQTERQDNAEEKKAAAQKGEDEKALQKLADRTQAISGLKDDLDRIIPYVNSSGDVPGVGPVVSALPEFLVSQEGTDVRQAALRLYRGIVREESGQTVTPQEAETALEAMGMGAGRSEGAWRSGMAALARRAQAALKNSESGFRPEVVAERARRGGTTSANIPQAGPRATGEEIDMPDGSVWEVLENGQTRRKVE